ncbi:MAG: aldolase/citrate lyase family protein [Patescibacteria group bacterium]|nr:aldolase/citrate lyase family protein [Patescibacteria group bacterium]
MKLRDVRSLHFIPAHKTAFLEHLFKDVQTRPDAIVFDLEDSVKPEAKDLARENLIKVIKENKDKLKDYVIIIRPNREGTPYYKKDVEAIQLLNPDAVLLPKVEDRKEIKRARKQYKNKSLIVAIETLVGIENIDSILSNLTEFDAVVAGYEDLSADLKIERPKDLSLTNPLTYLIFEVYISARKHSVIIFDAVCRYFKHEDLPILDRECDFTSNLRFAGKFSIHPNQISLIG